MSAEGKDKKSILHTVCCLVFLLLGTQFLPGQQKRTLENTIAPVSEKYKNRLYAPASYRPVKSPLSEMWEKLSKYTGMEKAEVGLSQIDLDSLEIGRAHV